MRKGGGSASTSPDKITSAVIDRLAQSSADTGIEILPASGPNVVGKGGGNEKSGGGGGRSGDSSASNNSGIKLTIKTPSKYYSSSSSKESSSSSSSSSKSRSSSSFSSSQHSGSKSSSSSHSDGRSKHSSSSSSKYSSSSSSSSHRHSQSSKDKSSSGGSGGSGTSKSSSSSSDRDKKKSGSDSGSGRYSSSSGSGSSHKEKEKQREEEVKKLFGGKLNKTFQIPKLSKGSSPSQKTPTTSPKYASISPKGQQGQQPPSSSYAPGASPHYIGGGSATPPALSSPKHPYSAPNSVSGVTRDGMNSVKST